MSGLDHPRDSLGLQLQLCGEGGVGVLPAVGGQRGVVSVGPADRAQARVGPQPLTARTLGRGPGGQLVGPELEETGVQLGDQRDVETVDPRHGLVGDVLVLVEGPARCQQQVAATHRHGVPVDVRPHALAVHDEPEGPLTVPVRGSDLARSQVLDRGPERGGGVRQAGQARVGQCHGPALTAPPHRHQLSGALRDRQQPRPRPQVRDRGRSRRRRHEIVALIPEWHQARVLEICIQFIEQLTPGRFACRVGHRNLQGMHTDSPFKVCTVYR